MQEITENVFVGCDADVAEFMADYPDGAVIHAAKEKWHREAVGYTGRGAPKDDPEYLVAKRGTELMLNLVDSPKPEFIPEECFDAAYNFFVEQHMEQGLPILIHCNQGKSRGPGVALYCVLVAGLLSGVVEDGLLDLELTLEELEHTSGHAIELGDGIRGKLEELL